MPYALHAILPDTQALWQQDMPYAWEVAISPDSVMLRVQLSA
jgi:hypothetical protein